MWDLIVSVPDHCLSFYFEISDIESRVIILSKKGTIKALIYAFVVRIWQNRFSHDVAQLNNA